MPHTLAYVLIQTASGKALSAAEGIVDIQGVKAAHPVTGAYDVICLVEAENLPALAGTVVERIQAVDGVERTETAVVVHAHE
jgi:DNA-binding Lrp family transcriptional regulator